MQSYFIQGVCPTCGAAPANTPMFAVDSYRVECGYCGTYEITGTAAAALGQARTFLTPRQQVNIQSWLRENEGTRIDSDSLQRLLTIPAPTVGERAEKLLVALSKREEILGHVHELIYGRSENYILKSASWSVNDEELRYLVDSYLVSTKHWLQFVGHQTFVKITPEGYEHLERIRTGGDGLQVGFCAMWFADEVKPLWTDAIEPAIQDAGYEAVRIDGVQHNNKIDDEILANIRRSKFVVADFTGHRGGVYFEAGFALGLGRQVIWTVRKDELEKTHFDNRQYNFLDWKMDDLPDFRRRLQLRIEATIGRGPV